MRLNKTAQNLGLVLVKLLLAFSLVTLVAVSSLRWLDPPISSFIVQRLIEDWRNGDDEVFVYYDWVPWDDISPLLPLAVVAAEDQRFPQHSGFDLVEIQNALQDYSDTGQLRGASTISQQVAKNLFLWPGRSLVRKGLEAWFTVLLETFLPKQRILELYLNIAQFGPDIFGVGPASLHYFNKSAADLTLKEASVLAAVLPNPERYRADKPSSYVRKRATWIRKQTRNLGSGYLRHL
jgi:monofunctional biosynthetic peptidoglycan transglycosylase